MKVGIIGAGGMLAYHIKGFRKAGATVAVIADLNFAAAQRAAKVHGVDEALGSVDALLGRSDIDAVSVIVPNKFHATLSVQALQAGKHVFCEKPPAMNVAELETMIAAADASGKRLMFNFNNRARPLCAALKAELVSGRVGEVRTAQAKWVRRCGIPGFGGWFTQKSLSGGGPLIDLMHMLDLALYYMDYPEPDGVVARTFSDFINDNAYKGPWGIPDVAGVVNDVESAAHGVVTFKSGQLLTFQNSWAEMVKREEVSVAFQGSQAGGLVRRLFEVDGDDDTAIDEAELYVFENGKQENLSFAAEPDVEMGRVHSAANFIHAIEGTAKPLNHLREALILMKIIDAAYQSASSGKAVPIS